MSELDSLAARFSEFDFKRAVAPVINRTGLEIKKRQRNAAPTGKHIRRYKPMIQYDVTDGGLGVKVGPKPNGQGLLSHILEYGGAGSAPHPHIIPALDAEAGVAEGFLIKAVEEAVFGDS